MSKYAKKRDANQTALQSELEKMGYAVEDVSRHSGLGCDLLVKRMSDAGGDVWLVEVKNPAQSKSDRKLTKSESALQAKFQERFRVLERAEDAVWAFI